MPKRGLNLAGSDLSCMKEKILQPYMFGTQLAERSSCTSSPDLLGQTSRQALGSPGLRRGRRGGAPQPEAPLALRVSPFRLRSVFAPTYLRFMSVGVAASEVTRVDCVCVLGDGGWVVGGWWVVVSGGSTL